MIKPACYLAVNILLPWEPGNIIRSFPSLLSFNTLLIPWWATSAIHILLILKPADFESCSSSSHNGSYNSLVKISLFPFRCHTLSYLGEAIRMCAYYSNITGLGVEIIQWSILLDS